MLQKLFLKQNKKYLTLPAISESYTLDMRIRRIGILICIANFSKQNN